jgi:hypothetical protein
MGFLRDLWRTRKAMKDLQKQAFGTTSSVAMLEELVQAAPNLIQRAGTQLEGLAADRADAERLRTEGVDAQATIKGVRDTGTTIGIGGVENPVAQLDLDIHADGRPDTRATIRTVVPRLAVARLVIGGTLPVKVDPADPLKVAVAWDQV